MDERLDSERLETAGENVEPGNESTLANTGINDSPATDSQQSTESSQTEPYLVLVDDNFHYMDPDERWTLGRYATLAEAITACKQLVEECLGEYFQPGMSADELYSQYTSFGDDPFILGSSQRVPFSAWDYTKKRCAEMTGTNLGADQSSSGSA
jgi:hypothetical protein